MQRLQLIKNHLTYIFSKIHIEYKEDGTIGIITLNNPKDYNKFDLAMRSDIAEALTQLENDPKVKVIIIRSSGDRLFAVGADIDTFKEVKRPGEMNEEIDVINKAVQHVTKPLIALVNGYIVAGAVDLMLSCDIILMSDDVKLFTPEVKIGTMPGHLGGTQTLTRALGRYNALRMILTGKYIGSQEAFRLGLCQGVYKKEKLLEEGMTLAKKIAEKPMTSIIMITKSIRASEMLGVREGMKFDRNLAGLSSSTKGLKEGSSAFLEKRWPNYKGL